MPHLKSRPSLYLSPVFISIPEQVYKCDMPPSVPPGIVNMSLSPEASGVAPTAVPALPVEVPSLDNNYGAIMLGTFGGLM